MVKQILTKAGFVENKTFKETRFLNPPTSTYCVYFDYLIRRGADYCNLIKEHSYTVEMYSTTPDVKSESAIEKALDFYGVEFEKQSRQWIQEEQLYQVVYDFDFIEK